jgi:predicted phosphoribosyltransferase
MTMIFEDRNDAARQLAEKLMQYKGRHPLVLAIPRGAVPMARLIADALDGSFDVVLVRKLRAPYQPELAIGSIDESGWAYLASHASSTGATAQYIEEEKQLQMATIRQRRQQYTPIRPPLDPAGRIVIVIDDGLATGATMISALHSLRAQSPAKLICAEPVAPPETLKNVAAMADEVICLTAPEYFQAVGQFYRNFAQVEDEEVIAILQHSA